MISPSLPKNYSTTLIPNFTIFLINFKPPTTISLSLLSNYSIIPILIIIIFHYFSLNSLNSLNFLYFNYSLLITIKFISPIPKSYPYFLISIFPFPLYLPLNLSKTNFTNLFPSIIPNFCYFIPIIPPIIT